MSSHAAFARKGLGRIGIWSASTRFAEPAAGIEAAQEVEALGFPSLWMPGGADGGILADLDRFLDATQHIMLATGIINVWKNEPAEVAAWWQGQSPERQARLLLGIGISHGPLIGDAYAAAKPLTKMRDYVGGLDAAGMPADRVCIAALGPKMLELSAARTAGSHPYLSSVAHTKFARKVMGPDALLAPELGVVLESDPDTARKIAGEMVIRYTAMPNYLNNWLRDGFSEEEIKGLAPAFIDSIFAWGDVQKIGAMVDAHLDAGADHVCLQVINAGGMGRDVALERPKWRALAKLL